MTKDFKSKEEYHTRVVIYASIVLIILACFSYYYSRYVPYLNDLSIFHFLIIYITIFLICFSKQVKANEIGVVLILGKPYAEVGAGYIFVPSFVYKLVKESSKTTAVTFTHRLDGSLINITHGLAVEDSADDPFEMRIISPINLTYTYEIASLGKYIAKVDSRKDLEFQLLEIIISALQIEFAKDSYAKNINRISDIRQTVQFDIRIQGYAYGVKILQILPDITMTQIVQGLSDTQITMALQSAKAWGYKKIARELGVAEPIALIQIEALTEMFNSKRGSNDFILTGDQSSLFATILSLFKTGSDIKRL